MIEVVIGSVLTIIVIGSIIVLARANKKEKKEEASARKLDPSCCGAHEICDFDKVKVDVNKIEYFEDEDLDAYQLIGENEYTDDQIEEFREILYSLKTDEIQHWLLSLSRRRIHLPNILNEEARDLMVNG